MTQVTIILGAGFTGRRLAARLRLRGEDVYAPVRDVSRFPKLQQDGVHLSELDLSAPDTSGLPRHARLAILIPPLPDPEKSALRVFIEQLEPDRIVYVSSTGVYGAATEVDETTPVDAADQRAQSRIDEERWLSSRACSTLILRSAAIYGPGRGVHTAVREGRVPRGSGSAVVSRIHVDDLVSLIDAGLSSSMGGAWPVADGDPCSTDEIVRWCLERFHIPYGSISPAPAIAGRRVSGKRILELLQVEIKYPSWRIGIPASIDEELRDVPARLPR